MPIILCHLHVSYPISIGLHSPPLQVPKTPKSLPANDARGICLTMGVEITLIKSNTKAANSRIVRGVAGRNIFEYNYASNRFGARPREGLILEGDVVLEDQPHLDNPNVALLPA